MKLKKNKLKQYRKKLELNQEMLAEMVEVSRQSIISIERGKTTPSLELALKFSKLFRCKVNDLFGV